MCYLHNLVGERLKAGVQSPAGGSGPGQNPIAPSTHRKHLGRPRATRQQVRHLAVSLRCGVTTLVADSASELSHIGATADEIPCRHVRPPDPHAQLSQQRFTVELLESWDRIGPS